MINTVVSFGKRLDKDHNKQEQNNLIGFKFVSICSHFSPGRKFVKFYQNCWNLDLTNFI